MECLEPNPKRDDFVVCYLKKGHGGKHKGIILTEGSLTGPAIGTSWANSPKNAKPKVKK